MQRSALVLTLGGMALRLALVAALLISGLRRGIVPGLLAFGGLWLTRMVAVICFQACGALWTSTSAEGEYNRPPKPQTGW
jgi:hypothetical protein